MRLLVDEALVVAEVEVGLAAVVGDEHLAVLEGVHRAGVDVDVRVELLHGDPEAPGLQQPTERGGGEPLAERAATPPVTKMCFAIAGIPPDLGPRSDLRRDGLRRARRFPVDGRRYHDPPTGRRTPSAGPRPRPHDHPSPAPPPTRLRRRCGPRLDRLARRRGAGRAHGRAALPGPAGQPPPHLRRRRVRRLGGGDARRRRAVPRRVLQPGAALPAAGLRGDLLGLRTLDAPRVLARARRRRPWCWPPGLGGARATARVVAAGGGPGGHLRRACSGSPARSPPTAPRWPSPPSRWPALRYRDRPIAGRGARWWERSPGRPSW